jgi:uncharacterized repeat protein (TIGR01451 family)
MPPLIRIFVLAGLVLVLAVPTANAVPQTTTVTSGTLTASISNATWVVPGAIVSPAFTTSTLTVPDLGVVTDVDLRLRASHTYVGDLGVFLDSPDGTSVFVAAPEGEGDDFGAGAPSCAGSPTVLDDEASVSIDRVAPPFAGSFKPHEPLSAFDGRPARGVWELSFIDIAPDDSGTLHCWELVITYEQPEVDLSLRGSDSPDPVRIGKQLRYTFRVSNGGPGVATNAAVTARIPAAARFVSAQVRDGACDRAGRTLTCKPGDLESGATATVTIVVKAPRTPGMLSANARVTSDQLDADLSDDRVRVRTKVKAA